MNLKHLTKVTEGTCHRCKDETELKDHEVFDFHSVVSPDDETLLMNFGAVCADCWDAVEEEWSTTGNLSKPMTAFA